MSWKYSLIIHNQETKEAAYKSIGAHVDKIKRVKFTTHGLLNNDVSYGEAKEMQEELKPSDIEVYIGGWITDTAIQDWDLAHHISDLQTHWISTIEAWNPTPETIRILKWEFKTVISEIGTKSSTDQYSHDHNAWERSLKTSLYSWIENIVLEGWNWTVWVYNSNYETKTLLLMHLMKTIKESWCDIDTVLECLQPMNQNYIYSLLWSGTHVWNINPLSLSRREGVPQLDQIQSKYPWDTSDIISKYYEIVDYLFESAKKRWINASKFMFDRQFAGMQVSGISKVENDVKAALREIVPRNRMPYRWPTIIQINGASSLEDILSQVFGV